MLQSSFTLQYSPNWEASHFSDLHFFDEHSTVALHLASTPPQILYFVEHFELAQSLSTLQVSPNWEATHFSVALLQLFDEHLLSSSQLAPIPPQISFEHPIFSFWHFWSAEHGSPRHLTLPLFLKSNLNNKN